MCVFAQRCFSLGQVKSLVLQLLSATEFMHRHWYIHRDLKTSNLLYNHQVNERTNMPIRSTNMKLGKTP